MTDNWVNTLSNPMGHIAKKYLFDLLKEKAYKHNDIIERISRALVTQNDLKNFGQLMAEVYETGFFKAVEDNKEAWEKLGYKTHITPSEKIVDAKKIFNQKNQE